MNSFSDDSRNDADRGSGGTSQPENQHNPAEDRFLLATSHAKGDVCADPEHPHERRDRKEIPGDPRGEKHGRANGGEAQHHHGRDGPQGRVLDEGQDPPLDSSCRLRFVEGIVVHFDGPWLSGEAFGRILFFTPGDS